MPESLADKKSAAGALELTADLLELLGAEGFRVNSYRAAARSLDAVDTPWDELVLTRFQDVPRIGKGLAAQLAELDRTGVFAPLEEASAQVPPGVQALFRVRGLGPKKIAALWGAGIESLEGLKAALEEGRVSALKGFGAKTAATLAASVDFVLASSARHLMHVGHELGALLLARLDGLAPRLAGSVRRQLDTVGDLDVTVTGSAEEVEARLGDVLEDLTRADYPAVRGTVEGVAVEVGYGDEATRGARDLMFGGSGAYLDFLHSWAGERGLSLSSAGLVRGNGELAAEGDERAVLEALGLPWLPPEYREPEHRDFWLNPAALPGEAELISTSDIRGLLHTHSSWSDGASSLREMAEAAQRLGPDCYLGTGDHSRSAFYANGLSIERLRAYVQEIRALQAEGLPILAGAEVDILEDGSLDFPDEELAQLDYVVASVHSRFELSREAQTARLVRAASHPLITILGHPTGRLLLQRPSYALDIDAVLAACEANATVVEINASPHRLDLDWREALRWRGRLSFAIDTDAHTPGGLGVLKYGVGVARKAGLRPDDVVNSLSRADFLDFVRRQRAGRVDKPHA